MKIPRLPHRWPSTAREALLVQHRLLGLVSIRPLRHRISIIAGLDAAFSQDGRECIAGVVLWDVERQTVLERQIARRPLTFPYVPGLLSFREGPALLAAMRKLRRTPDAIMCDGQGIAHPRRFGIACHLGVLCQLPSIGCAKSRLTGEYKEPGPRRGDSAPLTDGDDVIGAVLRTKDHTRAVFVSIGHRVDLPGAVHAVLSCDMGFRLPEPTRLADILVAFEKRNPPGTGTRLPRIAAKRT